MERRDRRVQAGKIAKAGTAAGQVIDPARFGVSFSLKQCRNFNLEPATVLGWLLREAGFRRFRLMSYWDEHQKSPGPGSTDFGALDQQVRMIAEAGGVITLCLGTRQPRWPENHWPQWAWDLPKAERTAALLRYIQTVVERYRDEPAVISYQLENEALLEGFGERAEVDRTRLRTEFALVKQLDPSRPVIMTTSTSWGIPVRAPIPDIVGFSFYRILYGQGRYHHALHFPRLDQLRHRLVRLAHRKPVFIHELQLEPWGPTAIWKMPVAEQDRSMSPAHIAANVRLAGKTKLYPIDLWGGEWWYWRLAAQHDPAVWLAVQRALKATAGR